MGGSLHRVVVGALNLPFDGCRCCAEGLARGGMQLLVVLG